MRIRNRLAFTTIGCPDWTFEQAAEAAAAMGFAAIEIRGLGPEIDFRKIECLQPVHQAGSLALLKQRGVRLCGLGASAAFHEAAGFDGAVEEGLAAVTLCRQMSIPFVRVFGDVFPQGEERDDTIQRVADGLTALCNAAAKAGGIKVLLEVHGQFNSAEVLDRLIHKMAGADTFGILWDVEHGFFAHGNDIEPLYEVIAPYVGHVHIKDCMMQDGRPQSCLPGQGEIDIPKIVRLLEGGNYTGLYSFEWERRWLPHLIPAEQAFPKYVSYMADL